MLKSVARGEAPLVRGCIFLVRSNDLASLHLLPRYGRVAGGGTLRRMANPGFEMNIDVLDALLTEHQLARKLGLTISGMRKLRWAGRGPRYLRLGRVIRYRVQDVEDWLKNAYEHSDAP
jgi:hypothetical protein